MCIRDSIRNDLGFDPVRLNIDVRDGTVAVAGPDLTEFQFRAVQCVVEGIPGASFLKKTT